MKKLLFVLLFLFSHFVYAVESINLEIRSNNDLIKQGDAGFYSFVVTGENLNPSEIRNIILQRELIKGVFVSNITSEDVGPNQITYKALVVFFEKEIPTTATAKINNTDYQINIKYFSLLELKDKENDLQILNQKMPWRILMWSSLFLIAIITLVLFLNRKEIYLLLNAKRIAKLKKDLIRYERKVAHALSVDELDKMKLEAKSFKDLKTDKNFRDELNSASSKKELENIYQKRKEFYVFDVLTKKQLSEFENKMNKIQYRPEWNEEDIKEIIAIIKENRGSR